MGLVGEVFWNIKNFFFEGEDVNFLNIIDKIVKFLRYIFRLNVCIIFFVFCLFKSCFYCGEEEGDVIIFIVIVVFGIFLISGNRDKGLLFFEFVVLFCNK